VISDRLGRTLGSVLGGFVLVLVSISFGRPAQAAKGDEGTYDVTQVGWDLAEGAIADGDYKGSPLVDPLAEDPWCHNVPSPPPIQTFEYKTVSPPNDAVIHLKADEYDPVGSGPFPIMVLVHGGGFAKGCRYSMDGVANRFATSASFSTHFISISIDYRQACDRTDPDVQGSIVKPMCGWPYSRVDPIRQAPGASIFDVEDAVTWVRNLWPTQSGRGNLWNGKIALAGGSGGGNLAYMAATLSAPGSSSRPDAVAGWSPFPRFTLMLNNTVWLCDVGQTRTVDDCSIGSTSPSSQGHYEGGINRYLPCPNIVNHYDSACESLYQVAAPYDVTNIAQLPPPIYVANGGGPTPGVSPPEISSLQGVIDYKNLLFQFIVQKKVCIVNTTDHGTRLFNDSCNGDPPGQTVDQSTVLFLAAFVCDAQHLCGG